MIVFGSFARHEAAPDSDIDVVIVCPCEIDEDDDTWVESIEAWRLAVRRLTGNTVEVLDVSAKEAAAKAVDHSRLWTGIRPTARSCTDTTPTSSKQCTLVKPTRTRPVSAAQVRAYAAKAQAFAEAAASAFDDGHNIAATSLAIHAGINSADAVCDVRLGNRAAGEDHNQVLALLRQAGPDGAEVGRALRRLLPLKTKAEYEPDDIAGSVTTKAVERAQRTAGVARRVAALMR